MATATAPTETPAPAESAAAPKPEPTPAPGPLARILTPVEPARPVQPLGSTATMGEVSDGSSRSGGNAKNTPAKGSDRGSPVAALVHALAARLARGGTAVKRTHTITETRVSGSTSTGQHRTNRDAKLADLNNKTQAGKTNHDQKHTTARDARTAATKSGRDHRDAKTGDTTDAKTAKTDTATRGNQEAKTSDSKAATTVTASKPDARTAPSPSTKTADGKTTAPGSPKAGTAPKTPEPTKPAATARPDGPDPTKTTDPKGLNAKTKPASEPTAPKPDAPAPVDPEKATGTKTPTAPTAPVQPAADPKLRTRPAREAGYRDGTRAAAVVGQARAYKDGAVDGWDDRTAADKAEQRRMDDARARNAAKPKPKDTPPMKPASGSTIDLEKKAAPAVVPAQVTAVGEKTVEFVADGAAHSMGRGEVRTLKAFERRLVEKKAPMQRIAEGSKATRLQAVELATRAQRLAENAKSVHGGARIVALLSRLAERSQVLRVKAEEIEKSAHRGSEAVKVLAANANTRHGGIYKAVVDSPLTTPAEREFYMDKQGG